MDNEGINKQILTVGPPLFWKLAENNPEMTKLANNALADLCNEYPDRFIPVGTIPLIEGQLEELDRCIDDLGMVGVQVFTNVDGKPLDYFESTGFFEKCSSKNIPIWIHPTNAEHHEWVSEYLLELIFGWPFETTLAMSRLVFSGIMDKYDLDVITHHVGGMIPFFNKRLEDQHTAEGSDFADRSFLDLFRRFYADTVICGYKPAINCGLDFFGSEKMVFATDSPFGPEEGKLWTKKTIETLEEYPEETREKVYSKNIQKVIGTHL